MADRSSSPPPRESFAPVPPTVLRIGEVAFASPASGVPVSMKATPITASPVVSVPMSAAKSPTMEPARPIVAKFQPPIPSASYPKPTATKPPLAKRMIPPVATPATAIVGQPTISRGNAAAATLDHVPLLVRLAHNERLFLIALAVGMVLIALLFFGAPRAPYQAKDKDATTAQSSLALDGADSTAPAYQPVPTWKEPASPTGLPAWSAPSATPPANNTAVAPAYPTDDAAQYDRTPAERRDYRVADQRGASIVPDPSNGPARFEGSISKPAFVSPSAPYQNNTDVRGYR